MKARSKFTLPVGVKLAPDVTPWSERNAVPVTAKIISVEREMGSDRDIDVVVELDVELDAEFTTTRGSRNPSLCISIRPAE